MNKKKWLEITHEPFFYLKYQRVSDSADLLSSATCNTCAIQCTTANDTVLDLQF